MTIEQFKTEQRKRDLYFSIGHGNVIFHPMGWYDFHQAYVTAGEDETKAHYPTHITPNSPCECMWTDISELSELDEITEAEARQTHPAMFQYLDELNKE